MPYADVPALVAELQSKAPTIGRQALLFQILTAARPGEVRNARWGQIDLAMRDWKRPATMMKTGKEHSVTLSAAAVQLLEQVKGSRKPNAGDPVFSAQRGGVGKSSFVASMLLSLASGRQEILGKTVWAGPKRVWYWNLEDGRDELEMQLVAASMFHGVGRDACADRIYLDSGPEGAELCIRLEERDGYRIAVPFVEGLIAGRQARKIDVLVVDPFVSSHGVSENDNSAIDAVVKTWAAIAKRAGCSVVLVHHSKKLGNEKVTAESSRGASALVSAARVTLVLNRMDPAEAQRFGIGEDKERRRLFTVQDDKANRASAEEAQWFRLASQNVANSTGQDDPFGEEGDSVGVVTRWTPPDAFEGITVDHLRRVQQIVAAGEYKAHHAATDWVGNVVAEALG